MPGIHYFMGGILFDTEHRINIRQRNFVKGVLEKISSPHVLRKQIQTRQYACLLSPCQYDILFDRAKEQGDGIMTEPENDLVKEIKNWVVNDYFTPNIKAEVILDTLLTPYVSEIINR